MFRICGIVAGVLTLAFCASAQAATLKADYRFENSLASSVPGASDLTNAPASPCPGNGPNFWSSAKVFTRRVPVLAYMRDGGVIGPAYPLIAKGSYSIVVDLYFTSNFDGAWRRILDLSNSQSDDGFYVSPGDVLNYWNTGIGGTTTFTNNAWHQVVLTRVGTTKLVSEYLDGNLEASFTDNTVPPIATAPTNTIFFQDNQTGGPTCESTDGAVSRIRLYTGALTSTAIAALRMLPPAPAVALGATAITGGQSTTITGKNFGPNEQVQISFTDAANTTTVVDTVTTDTSGGFSTSEVVPNIAVSGTGTFTAVGQTSTLKAKRTISVTAT